MKTCFGYVRVSTEKQGEGVSLSAQKEAIEQFAQHKGLIVSKWFEEKQSAAKAGRPIFNEMLAKLKRREADGLIIHKIDRSVRNYHDWDQVGELIDSGIEFHVATENLDFNTYGGRMAADFMAVVATNYIRNLRSEIKKGQQGLLKRGYYPFRAPVGYLDKGKGELKVPDSNRARLIRETFEMYDSGEHSLRSLLVAVTEMGLTNRQGRPLSLSGLETILRNPFYCGLIHIRRNGQTFQGKHKPLISTALFQRVQDRKANRCGKKVTRHNHLFRGIFRCGYCNRPMVPELQKGRVYYRCKLKGCKTTTIREDRIDPKVRSQLAKSSLSRAEVKQAAQLVSSWISEQKDSLSSSDINDVRLSQIKSRLARAADLLIDGTITEETYKAKKAELLLEERRYAEMKLENQNLAEKAENFATMAELLISVETTYDLANRHEKQKLLQLMTPNSRVFGKQLEFTTPNWVQIVRQAITVFCGAQQRDIGRTITQIFDVLPRYENIDELLEPVDPVFIKLVK